MDEHSITLRAGEPTVGEGILFARYLDQAAEGFFRVMLGRRSAEILAEAYTQPGHDYSYEYVTFAEHDGVVVGLATAYTGEQHRRSSDEPLKRAPGYRRLRMMRAGLFRAPFRRLLGSIPDGDYYLLALAVDKQLRGHGVGSILIDEVEKKAVAVGAARLALDVAGKNEGARRLYERRGMTAEWQWPKRLAVPGITIIRMTKVL